MSYLNIVKFQDSPRNWQFYSGYMFKRSRITRSISMKRMTKISTAVLTALASLSAPIALAQSSAPGADGDYYWGLRLGLGWTDTDRIASFDETNNPQFFDGGADVFMAGIEAGYRFAENWEARVYFEDLQGDIGGTSDTAYGDSWGADVLYSFTE